MAVDSETDRPKKLMNSNVAIEYGFAERAISDQKILLVQNEYYGGRNDLPFDLKHKAGPIRYNLAPDANPTEIESAKVKLRGAFVGALRPFLATRIEALVRPAFTEIQAQPRSPAYFADGNCVLASVGKRGVDEIEYRLREARVFYLRLIPQRARDPQLRFSDLLEVINKRRVQTLSRQVFAGVAARNSFGGIVYEPSGDNPNPKSLTQLFQNGEIWGIGTGFHLEHQGDFIIPAQNVEGIVLRVLQNFCDIATLEFGVAPPFCVEMGGLCLGGAFLGAGMRGERFGPIHQEQLTMRRVISDVTEKSLQAVVGEFLDQLFNLAGVDRPALS
jgi:hypothetical protein